MSKGDLMTDTEKAELERRIDELCAENERLRQLASDMNNCFCIGAVSGAGISVQWCRELYTTYTDKLRNAGVEVPS